MHVLQVHNRYRTQEPSGEDRVVDQEGAALTAAGHRVERFERFSDEIEQWSRPRRLGVAGKLVWSNESRWRLNRALAHSRPDVVHIHNTFPLLSPSVLQSCRQLRVPAVVTFHNYRPICPSGTLYRAGDVCHDCVGHFPLAGVRHGCYRDSAAATAPLAVAMLAHRRLWQRLVSAYVFISASQREQFEAIDLPPERTFVKANLVPRPAIAAVPLRERRHRVVYLGRLSATKGVPTLLEAWDRLFQQAPACKLSLAIAGAGPLEDHVRRWAGSREGVEFLGLLGRDACQRLVAESQAVVVPSTWLETFGLVVVEAKAVGVASIASARGSLTELVEDGVDGLLFEPGSAAALAEVLHQLEVSSERFDEMGTAAAAAYDSRFDPERNLEQLVSIYRFAIQRPVTSATSPRHPAYSRRQLTVQ